MTKSISTYIEMCAWGQAKYLVISDNVFSALVYYSHLLPILATIVFAIFIFFQNRKSLAARALLFTSLLIVLWLYFDLILWATDKPSYTMFFWSLVIMIEPMIYWGVLYFSYVFIKGNDMSFTQKIYAILLLLPTVILAPTKLALSGFDLSNCDREAIEGPLVYYGYIVELLFTLWIILLGTKEFISKKKTKGDKIKIFLITTGSGFLLLSFAVGNVIGSWFVDWTIGQYGLFGIPIFIAFLSYLIVKYNAFNIKLIGSQALVVALWLMVFAVLFIEQIELVRIVISITLLIIGGMGIMLVKSVKKERLQLEKIQELASDLEKANVRLKALDKEKTEFVSLASHQLRAPMTAIKGYISMIFEGDYGEVPKPLMDPVKRIFTSTQSLVQIVGDFLDVSRIELGTMKFNFTDFDLKALVKQITEELQPNIEISKLEFKFDADEGAFPLHGDSTKLKQVFNNLIDNALKYTKSGCVHVSLTKTADKYTFKVIDSGVGINREMIPKLFDKFVRASNANEANVIGTGLGLYVARQMVDKHHGKIWAESEGEGKGSTFVVEIPAT